MLSLMSAFTMAVLASAPASGSAGSWVKDGQVYIRFYDLAKVAGPLKFYVAANSCPAATDCATCPSGTNAEYVVQPQMVWQEWPQGGKYLEVHFPHSSVGNLEQFGYTAVSVLNSEERLTGTGYCSAGLTAKNNGKR